MHVNVFIYVIATRGIHDCAITLHGLYLSSTFVTLLFNVFGYIDIVLGHTVLSKPSPKFLKGPFDG